MQETGPLIFTFTDRLVLFGILFVLLVPVILQRDKR